MECVTVLVAVSMTATRFDPPGPVSPPVTVAYTSEPEGETATSCGYAPTSISDCAPEVRLVAITLYCPVCAMYRVEPDGVTAMPSPVSAPYSPTIVSVATLTLMTSSPPAAATYPYTGRPAAGESAAALTTAVLLMVQCGAPSIPLLALACAEPEAEAELNVPVKANAVTGAPMTSRPAAAAPATTVARR